jgi:hypothetical protein
MRAFVAAIVGGGIGFMQVFILALLDASRNEESTLPKGDAAYWIFACTWVAETIAVIAISMYRFSPFVARMLGDNWEANRSKKEKKTKVATVEWLSSAAIIVRRAVQLFDSGHLSRGLFFGLAIASLPFVIRAEPKASGH